MDIEYSDPLSWNCFMIYEIIHKWKEMLILIYNNADMLWVIVITLKNLHCVIFLVLSAHVQELLDNRTGVFESIQCGRTKLDRWERELTPTSAATSLLLPVTSLLPGFFINKLSSSSYCFHHTCVPNSAGNPHKQRWGLARSEWFSKLLVQQGI